MVTPWYCDTIHHGTTIVLDGNTIIVHNGINMVLQGLEIII